MSAETMRRAAALMRERSDAQHVPNGPWKVAECHPETPSEHRVLGTHSVVYADSTIHAYVRGFKAQRVPVADHIAGWDPTVARAVADLLEAGADEFERRAAKHGIDSLTAANPTAHALVAIATTYLDEEGS